MKEDTKYPAAERGYNEAIDLLKGFLVLSMILAHCIQFFGEEEKGLQKFIVDYVNLTTFSGFLFAYGFVCYCAYFTKNFKDVRRKMLQNAGRTLAAFYLSSIAFLTLAENKVFKTDILRDVITIRLFGGWSEFLVSFTGVMLMAMLLFPLYKKLNSIGLAVIAAVCLMTCFVPYEKITVPWLALFLGSRHYVTFPVIQYSVYFAAGVIVGKYGWKYHRYLLSGSLVFSLPTIIYILHMSKMPERFPPSLLYITGGAFFLYTYYLLFSMLSKNTCKNRILLGVKKYLKQTGSNSLFYLLMSNVFIFGFKGASFHYKDIRYALIFYLVLLLVIHYLTLLISKNRRLPNSYSLID